MSQQIKLFEKCPRCGGEEIIFSKGNQLDCKSCGFQYFHNVAAAVMVLIEDSEKENILFTTRNREPGKGLLDFAGGFVDPKESANKAVSRELFEELGIEVNETKLQFLGSFPNEYKYKDILYNTLDIAFVYTMDKNTELDTCKEELESVQWISRDKVDFEALAFVSAKRVLEQYLSV